MPTHMDRRTYKRKLPKCLPLKNYKSESFDVHIWGTYVHMYTKCEVSTSIPVPGEVCTDDANANDDDGQFMTV